MKYCVNYLLFFFNSTIIYRALDIILWVHSNRAYLVESNAKSKVIRHFFLSNFINKVNKAEPKLNKTTHALYKILKNIISLAIEYEIVAAFKNDQDATVIQQTLIEIDYS